MSSLFEVKEFDRIISGREYGRNGKYVSIPESSFEEFKHFIRSFSSTENTGSDVLDFFRISYRRDAGDIIHVRNYVGLIQLNNGDRIQILPKISLSEEDENNSKTKSIFIKMLMCLKDFPCKTFSNSSLDIAKTDLLEIFINMYITEVNRLVKQGLRSAYIEQEENQSFFKGKLLASSHIKNNIVHNERFYVRYDEFSMNRPENRLLKATLNKLSKISGYSDNRKSIRSLLTYFDGVEVSTNYHRDLSLVVPDRSMKAYEILLKWSRIFLLGYSFTSFSGDNSTIALLFPMEKIFEDYVAQLITKKFKGWNIKTQDRGYYLYDNPKCFALRPDVVARKADVTIIIDTKWKNLAPANHNFGISESDMYQMYVYYQKYNAKEIWLLYPLNDEIRSYNKEIIYNGKDVKVCVKFIDLEKSENSIDLLYEEIEK